MNLQSLIEQFIAYRQSLREQWPSNCTVRAFGRFIGAGVGLARLVAVSSWKVVDMAAL